MTILIGADQTTTSFTIQPGTGSLNGLYVWQAFTATANGNLGSLSVDLSAVGSDIVLALYSSASPPVLLGQTNQFTPAIGVNTANLQAPVAITSGTSYKLAIATAADVLHLQAAGGSANALTETGGTFPTLATNIAATSSQATGVLALWGNAATSATPTLTSVNSGSPIVEASANVTVVGTNLTSATITIIQGSTSIAQTANSGWGATGGTFNLVMEPGGAALSFGAATLQVTVSGQTASLGITLAPLAGLAYVVIGTPNTDSAERITTTPVDIATGDQLEVSGNSAGTAAAPTGLTVNTDGTQQWADGATLANFYARAWDSSDSTWGTWSLQTAVTSGVTITIPASLIPALHQFLSLLPG